MVSFVQNLFCCGCSRGKSLETELEAYKGSLVFEKDTFSYLGVSTKDLLRALAAKHEGGVAALGVSGRIYLGKHVALEGGLEKNSIHPIAFLITNARSYYERSLSEIAISRTLSDIDRAFLEELPNKDTCKLHMPGGTTQKVADGPYAELESDILMRVKNPIPIRNPTITDYLSEAAMRSYTHATKDQMSGIVLTMQDDRIVTGSLLVTREGYSLAPLQGALVILHILNRSYSDIKEVFIEESKGMPYRFVEETSEILQRIAPGVQLTQVIYE